jgi:hypothetical protein
MLDFYIHRAYVERIWSKVTSRPYTLAGQEAIFKDWAPKAAWGMPHPYSPAMAIVFGLFVWLTPDTAYLVFSAINSAAILLLLVYFILPRISDYWSLAAVLIVLISQDYFLTLLLGQTAILTTGGLALIWSLLYNQSAQKLHTATWTQTVALGIMLFALSAKPQIAAVGAAFIVSARQWKALLLGLALIVANFTWLGPYYGGWPHALSDYLHFLSHYYKQAMTPFFDYCFQYHIASNPTDFLVATFGMGEPKTAAVFQPLYLAVLSLVAVLSIYKKISLPAAFQLQLGALLLLAPYLRFTEDLAILLIICGGKLFGTQKVLFEATKLILLFLVVNYLRIWSGDNIIMTTAYPAKLALAAFAIWTWKHSDRKQRA